MPKLPKNAKNNKILDLLIYLAVGAKPDGQRSPKKNRGALHWAAPQER